MRLQDFIFHTYIISCFRSGSSFSYIYPALQLQLKNIALKHDHDPHAPVPPAIVRSESGDPDKLMSYIIS